MTIFEMSCAIAKNRTSRNVRHPMFNAIRTMGPLRLSKHWFLTNWNEGLLGARNGVIFSARVQQGEGQRS